MHKKSKETPKRRNQRNRTDFKGEKKVLPNSNYIILLYIEHYQENYPVPDIAENPRRHCTDKDGGRAGSACHVGHTCTQRIQPLSNGILMEQSKEAK